MHEASSYTFRLWGTTNFRSIQKDSPYKIALGNISYRWFKKEVETAKRILIKEKINRQLARQSSSTPFMSIKDNYNIKVIFDTWGGLEHKIDKLIVMIGKLASRDNGNNRQFKPQIYQSRRREQIRNFLWFT